MKAGRIVGAIVILGFLLLGGTAFKKTLTPYVSFNEARNSGRAVQVAGKRTGGDAQYDPKTQTFRFDIADDQHQILPVVYHGVKPGAFDEAKQIVAIGEYRDGAFQATKLLVKCPSKYQGQDVRQMDKVYKSGGTK